MREVADESDILRFARALALSKGEPDPELVQHTSGTRTVTTAAVSGGSVTYGDELSWLIAIKGSFNALRAYLPNHEPPAGQERFTTYSVQTVVVEIRSGRATDFGGRETYPDLAVVGPVVTDYQRSVPQPR